MRSNRCLLVFFCSAAFFTASARRGPRPLTAAQIEARNEAAAPSFSAQAREAGRITAVLADALFLNYAQQHAVRAYTLARHQALALAVTAADRAQAQSEYHAAMQRILAASQLATYAVLCRRYSDTLQPLDAVELAAR